jgi:hypothetical protein
MMMPWTFTAFIIHPEHSAYYAIEFTTLSPSCLSSQPLGHPKVISLVNRFSSRSQLGHS